MSDENQHGTDPSNATTSATSTTGTDDTVTLSKSELADLLKRAANDSASRTRRAIESDPRTQRAKRLEALYSTALAEPEPVKPEPAKPAASSRLEQMLERYMEMQILEKMPAAKPAVAETVRSSDLIAHAQREATRGLQPGSPAFNEAIKVATAAALKKYRLKGG